MFLARVYIRSIIETFLFGVRKRKPSPFALQVRKISKLPGLPGERTAGTDDARCRRHRMPTRCEGWYDARRRVRAAGTDGLTARWRGGLGLEGCMGEGPAVHAGPGPSSRSPICSEQRGDFRRAVLTERLRAEPAADRPVVVVSAISRHDIEAVDGPPAARLGGEWRTHVTSLRSTPVKTGCRRPRDQVISRPVRPRWPR
jgi:hypothetical protein